MEGDIRPIFTEPDKDVFLWLQDQAPVPAEYDNDNFVGLKAVCLRKNPT